MEVVSCFVGPIVEQALVPIKRHLGYLIFYKRNIHNMEIKFNDELDPIRKDVQQQVEEADRERLEEVATSVEAWLKEVNDADEKVKRIKDEEALAANNNGCLHFSLHYRLGRQAAHQIKDIDNLLVKKRDFNIAVSHNGPPPSTTGSLLVNYEGYAMFKSRESCLNEILDALKDKTVHKIGVYGMAGIGKTTLVKEAANKAMNDGLFTEVVMVTVSQNLNMKRIQTGIAESLGLELNEETVEVRAGKIEGRLGKEGNRVLVVLDDLWEMLELSKVRIPDRNNKGTCTVLITTRRKEVCDQMDCQKKVELRTLSDEESWLLFNSRAEINVVDESQTIMKEVAWDVAKECAGLPLALVVLGTVLKGKNSLEIWKTVLNQLKKSTIEVDLQGVNEKVGKSIALSYNFLERKEAKLCFLHCCLYPEDYDIEEADLMHMLVGAGLLEDVESLHNAQKRMHVLMDQLKASCLLLEGRKESCVIMHDVVRDVAIWIGERDHGFFVRAGHGLDEWPRNISDVKLQNCRRLSLMSNQIVDLTSDPIKCRKLETLILSGNLELSNISENIFQHMRALKVLDLSFTKISSLPESFSCLTSLRVLNLKGCTELQDISLIYGLKILEILDLTDTKVSVVPEDTRGLLNLRLVDLGDNCTTSLSSYFSNVLRGCSRLEQLFIPNYKGCLAELTSLRFLTHLRISGVVDSNHSLSKDLGSTRFWINLEECQICFGELDAIREDLQREVEAVDHERLQEVDSTAVEAWSKKVKDPEEEVKRIKDETSSRQAAAQIQAIDDLPVKKRDFNGVSHSGPPSSSAGSLLVNEGYVMFESRKTYINEILDAFKDEAVYMIGVYGMGGIGKTTLVEEAARQAMNDGLFTEVVMVTVPQNLDVKEIQSGIAESLGLELNEETVQVRAGKIEGRLGKKGNRVLVILDDLWTRLVLSKVRIPYRNKGTCKVLITTRREDVCDQMDCQKKVELRTLSDKESWSLFKSRAEINVVGFPTVKEVAQNVAKQCAGLPLALVVLGTMLKHKRLEVWKIALNQLEKSTMALDLPGVSSKVGQSIELSYRFLASVSEQWCFLHCCLYPEDYEIDEKDLMHMLVGGGLLEDVESLHQAQDRVYVLMNQLNAIGLLLDGKRKSCVRMQDVVRDVGIWIGERDHGFFVRAGQGLEEWPRISDTKLQTCQRLSLMSNNIVDLPSDPIKCTKLETLILRNNRDLSNIPEIFFQHMEALKVLDLSFTKISCLPESLSCLTSLRVLKLKGCSKLQDISPINGLKMLEILILKDTRVSVVPEDTRGLLNLRLLDLGDESTTSLITYFSNVLRGCSRLEQLFMPKYEGCLAELTSLRFLTHLHILGDAVDSNDSLSQDLGSSRSWTKLQEFLICFVPSCCRSLLLFPQVGTRSLHLARTKLFSPSLKVLLEKIESLALVHCQESEVISSKCDIPPHVFHNLTSLVVSGCLNLTSLGDEPLFQLKHMRVENCPKLVRLLPSKVWQSMHQLQELDVRHCKVMLHLFPYDHKPLAMIELLPKLEELKLFKLPQLESVLQPFQCLPNLMTLRTIGCGLRCGLVYHEMEMVADPFPKLKKLDLFR